MHSDEERQKRRNTLMLKHRKKTGGFVPATGHSRLRSLYSRCKIDPALDIFLFKPKKRKVRTYD